MVSNYLPFTDKVKRNISKQVRKTINCSHPLAWPRSPTSRWALDKMGNATEWSVGKISGEIFIVPANQRVKRSKLYLLILNPFMSWLCP